MNEAGETPALPAATFVGDRAQPGLSHRVRPSAGPDDKLSEIRDRTINTAMPLPGFAYAQPGLRVYGIIQRSCGTATSRQRRIPRLPAARPDIFRETAGSALAACEPRPRPNRTGPRCTAYRPPRTIPARR